MNASKYSTVFIVTYGRSGSTLLQGVLNSIPGYLVRGENNNLLGRLLAIHKGLTAHHRDGPTWPENAWYGSEFFTSDIIAPALRSTLETILFGDVPRDTVRTFGFKEIRYGLENIDAKLDFLRTLYPDSAVIFNTRNADDVARSMEKNFGKSRNPEEIKGLTSKFSTIAEADGNAYLIGYEDVVAVNDRLHGLFSFLGEPFDEEAVRGVLSRKHSYHRGHG